MNEPAAEPEPASAPSKAPTKAGNPAVTWTIRIVVFGVLGALLIVAVLQFMAKRKFEASQTAILDKFEATPGMVLKDVEELLEGDYEISAGKGDQVFNVKIYTWSGPITDYTLRIKYAKLSKTVQRVSGKDEDAEEAAE